MSVVDEAIAAFSTDLDYATALVGMYVSAPVVPVLRVQVWGAPPRFVADVEVPSAPSEEDLRAEAAAEVLG